MGKISYLFLLSVCIFFNACQKGPSVDIPFRAYVTIPAGLNTGLSHHFIVQNIPGVNYENLEDAQPAYVTLTIEYGEINLDFIQQGFFLTRDGTLTQEIAYQTNLPITNYSSIQLYPSILNMSEHISQDLFDMELKLIFRSIPVTETKIRIDFGIQGVLGG
ncbi:MAG: hypothetical protein MK207_02195 [Saprospiraceae bacterium]|nr:hypothetical protein [Saprospiraceae bacterium]